MAAVLLAFGIIATLTSTLLNGETSALAALGKSSFLFVCLSLLAIWSLKINLGNWPGVVTPRPPTEPSPEQINAGQRVLITRIQEAMSKGIWRNEGLTIATLATEVDAPEHQVRKAINRVLGYRNFSSFINQTRIEEAKDRLISPEHSGKTVLEIAYSVGFNSLGPFNRAFREETGASPSEYRERNFATHLADSGKSPLNLEKRH